VVHHFLLNESQGTLHELRGYIDSTEGKKALDLLAQLMRGEIDRYESVLSIHEVKGETAALRAMRSGAKARLLDRMHLEVSALTRVEEQALVQRTMQVRENSGVSRVTAYVAGAFNVGLLCFVFYLTYREVRDRKQAEEALRYIATHDQ